MMVLAAGLDRKRQKYLCPNQTDNNFPPIFFYSMHAIEYILYNPLHRKPRSSSHKNYGKAEIKCDLFSDLHKTNVKSVFSAKVKKVT